MPTYEYECRACGHRLEAFHSISADPLTDCPVCEKPELKRCISGGAGLLFKGNGFYQTDYRSESYKKDAKADKPASASDKKSDSGKKTENKAASSK